MNSTLCRLFQMIDNHEQGTAEWHAKRYNYLTASEFPAALGHADRLLTRRTLFRRKAGLFRTAREENPVLAYGHRTESVARDLYMSITGEKVYTFGCIAYTDLHEPDERYNMLAGSPDGITESGKLLEIKCPYRRPISDTVPPEYVDQIQGLMFILDLEQCDFMQYKGPEEYSIITVPVDKKWQEAYLPMLRDTWNEICTERIRVRKDMEYKSLHGSEEEQYVAMYWLEHGQLPPLPPRMSRIVD